MIHRCPYCWSRGEQFQTGFVVYGVRCPKGHYITQSLTDEETIPYWNETVKQKRKEVVKYALQILFRRRPAKEVGG